MEKLILTIEGTADEVVASIRKLQGLVVGVHEQTTNASWLPNEIEQFMEYVQSGARGILVEIAAQPEGYDRDELLGALSMDARVMAGTLSSIGHTLRRYYPMKPRPIELDWDSWKYAMLPEFAEWIRDHEGSS